MKTFKNLKAVFFLFLIICASFSHAQPSDELKVKVEKHGEELNLIKDTTAHFISFTGREISGNIYLQWSVEKLKEDGTFIIYSSKDGKNYQPVGTEKAIGVPFSNAIGYYFKCKELEDRRYIKILYLSNSSKFLSSNQLSLVKEAKDQANKSKN
jgi:hypothetical protein